MTMPFEPPEMGLLQAKEQLTERFLRTPARGGLLRASSARNLEAAVADIGNNVHAVGIGRKVVEGQLTDAMSVRVYVTQKLEASLLPDFLRIPAEVNGFPTDVIESPPAFLLPAATVDVEEAAIPGIAGVAALSPAAATPCSVNRQRTQRPVIAGISTALVTVTAGTLSCFCRSTQPGDDPEEVYVLSNNHVFADVNRGNVGDPLLQPGPFDGGTMADRFADLERFVTLQLGGVNQNRVDAAIGKLRPGISFTPQICSIGSITGTEAAAEQMRVRKHGRTTGLTEGVVTDVSYTALVGMDHTNPSIVALFVDQIRIERVAPFPAFGLGGDSGSLVVHGERQNAVGLYFAGPENGFYGVANPIAEVLTEVHISIL
jgi:hypothetical protein